MTKEEIAKRHKETILNEMLKSVVSELFACNQEYTECLNTLIGKEIIIGDHVYTFSKANDLWSLECKGTFSWMIKFGIHTVMYDDQVHDLVNEFKLVYNEHLISAPLLADLIAIVVEVLSTYHPDGRKLSYSQE